MRSNDRSIFLDAHDIFGRQIAFVNARWGDPDITIVVFNGEIAAAQRGHPVVINAIHNVDQLVARVQKLVVHKILSEW